MFIVRNWVARELGIRLTLRLFFVSFRIATIQHCLFSLIAQVSGSSSPLESPAVPTGPTFSLTLVGYEPGSRFKGCDTVRDAVMFIFAYLMAIALSAIPPAAICLDDG